MVRPVSTEVLQGICEDIAMENYGFVYLNDHKGEIKEAYEQTETGFKYKSSLSLSDIKKGMQEIADDEFNSFERLRGDAYFLNPFEDRQGKQIRDAVESLFTSGDLVLHKERIESEFDIAPTDVDFFARQLIDQNWMERVPAGERDYFVSGPDLKDETSRDIGLDAQLKNKSDTEGKISHRDLEEIVDVAATENVIDYLSQNDFIIDLDGEYLVQEALDKFVESLREQIEDDVAEELHESDYVLHESEFEQVVENAINEHSDILKQARSIRRDIIELTLEALQDRLGLEEEKSMIVMYDNTLEGDGFEQFVDKQARSVKQQVARSDVTITKKSEQESAGNERIVDLQLGRTQKSQEFIQDAIQERYEELVDQEW